MEGAKKGRRDRCGQYSIVVIILDISKIYLASRLWWSSALCFRRKSARHILPVSCPDASARTNKTREKMKLRLTSSGWSQIDYTSDWRLFWLVAIACSCLTSTVSFLVFPALAPAPAPPPRFTFSTSQRIKRTIKQLPQSRHQVCSMMQSGAASAACSQLSALKLIVSRLSRGSFDRAKNHERQRRKRQSVTAKREKSLMPKFV